MASDKNKFLFLVYSILLLGIFLVPDLFLIFIFNLSVICGGEFAGCHLGVAGAFGSIVLLLVAMFCWLWVVKKIRTKMFSDDKNITEPMDYTSRDSSNNF